LPTTAQLALLVQVDGTHSRIRATNGIPNRTVIVVCTSRITKPGILVTTVVVLAGSAAQLIDYGFFGLRIGLLDSATGGGIFGAVGDIALATAAGSAWVLVARVRSAHPVVGILALLLTFLAVDKVTRLHEHVPHWLAFYLPVLAAAFLCLMSLARCRSVRPGSRVDRSRDGASTDPLISTGLALLAFSLLVHVFGDRLLVELGANSSGWAYQIKAVAKHGTEVAGWLLTALGLLRLAPRTSSSCDLGPVTRLGEAGNGKNAARVHGTGVIHDAGPPQ
jgi:hypothetical protein